jgi:DnaK suppressor protein
MAARTKKEKAKDDDLIHGIKPYVLKKGEKYMNKKQQAHFQAILSAWKQELEDEIERTIDHMRDGGASAPDPNDRASQETDMSLELRSRDREGKLVKKINEALERLEDGDYGYCEKCGEEVGVSRLEARPTAELCIDCKTLDEIREKQLG